MARIVGLVFSGFMVKVYAIAMALYVGSQAARLITDTFATIQFPN